MSIKDDMEKALTIFTKPETVIIDRPEKSLAERWNDIAPKQPTGDVHYQPIQPRPNVNTYAPMVPNQQVACGVANVPIITDQLEFPRVCSSRFGSWMARYAVRDNRLYWLGGIRLDEIRQHLQYAGLVHQSYQVDSGLFGVEECPCCGSTGKGAIRCLNCERLGQSTFICWGFVYVKGFVRYTKCPTCYHEAMLVADYGKQLGIFPRVRP